MPWTDSARKACFALSFLLLSGMTWRPFLPADEGFNTHWAEGTGLQLEFRSAVVDRELRKSLTRAYRTERYGEAFPSHRIEPRMIVVHWTALPDLETSFRAFHGDRLRGREDISSGSALNVGTHFLVDRDGSILQLLPIDWMGRHVIGLNHTAIGIENVGGVGGRDDLTEAQLEANEAIVRALQSKFPEIEYLIGHHEYRSFEDHPFWKERDDNYRTVKTDPGDRFMNALRSRLDKFSP